MYTEVLGVATNQWQVGKMETYRQVREIKSTRARPLTGDEVKEACRILNAKTNLENPSLEHAKALLDECYDAIGTAIYSEDGLDGSDGEQLLTRIEVIIGQTANIKGWTDKNRPVT